VREDRGSTAMGLETLLTPIRLLNLEVLQCMAGVNRAMLDYGKCLLGGIGVAASQSLAKYWFQRAAQQGSKEARDLIPKWCGG